MAESGSCAPAFQLRNVCPERDQGTLCLLDRAQSLRCDLEDAFGPPTPFGCGFAQAGRDVAMAFEPFERRVDGRQCDFPPGSRLDLTGDWHAVGLVADAQRRQKNHQLEVGQQLAWHLLTNYEYTPHRRQTRSFGSMAGMNRRDLLLTLLATPFAARPSIDTAAFQGGSDAELILCGWDEVFILALGDGVSPTHRKVWSWRASDSPEIPAELHATFRTTDDCKPVDGGRRILISSSAGGIAVVDRETRRASFQTQVTNAHSVEMLPGDRIAVAASVSTTSTGDRIVIFDARDGKELTSDMLRSAHGVVWDDSRRVLWAVGGDVLRAYDIGVAGSTRLERTFELALPDGGGHDLAAIPGASQLFVSTLRRAWLFDRDRRALVPHDVIGGMANIKSYAVHPRTGRVVYVQGESPNWWAEHLHFQRPDGQLHLPGEHLYKARWN